MLTYNNDNDLQRKLLFQNVQNYINLTKLEMRQKTIEKKQTVKWNTLHFFLYYNIVNQHNQI